MKQMYAVLQISPFFVLIGGVAWSVQDFAILFNAPPDFQLQIGTAAIAKVFFSIVGAVAVYWLRRIVDAVVPGVRG